MAISLPVKRAHLQPLCFEEDLCTPAKSSFLYPSVLWW